MSKVLLGEIDGANITLTLAEPGRPPGAAKIAPRATATELESQLAAFLEQTGQPALAAAAFCAPGPVQSDAI